MDQEKNIRFHGIAAELLKRMAVANPMLRIGCAQLMEAEASGIVRAKKDAHNVSCGDYLCGCRPPSRN